METVTISKMRFDRMQEELTILRNSGLYKRLLEFEQNISKGRKYTRAELGF